jgi:hypothetical protein
MSDLKNGMLVQHASLGLGKIVALEGNAVHVFFETSDKRFATKLRLPAARPLLCPSAAKNAWLKGMSSFSRDPKTGRYGLAQTWIPQDQAIARFTEAFPRGFSDPKYVGSGGEKGERAGKWRAAHEAFLKALGGGEGERLLADGKVDELVRRALRVERHVALLHPPPDKASLKDALQDPAASRDFFAALFELLAAPAPDRPSFGKLAAAVAALPQNGPPGFGWQVGTLLLFIAQPDRHMLLRPKATCDAAQRLGFDLSYDATPNWTTYSALLRCTELLLGTLKPLGARDYIDVESFLHVTAAKRAGA